MHNAARRERDRIGRRLRGLYTSTGGEIATVPSEQAGEEPSVQTWGMAFIDADVLSLESLDQPSD